MRAAAEAPGAAVDPASISRKIWAAANLMRDGGFNTLETIDHLTLLLFLRLFSAGARHDDLLARCASDPDPIGRFGEELATLQGEGETATMLSVRDVVDGFDFRIEDERLFKRLADLLLQLPLDTTDLSGFVYERLIATLSDAGHLGQYFTPRHIVNLMVSLVAPKPGESVYDPACGTGGFLIGVTGRSRENDEKPPRAHGRELNRTVHRLCVMNLIAHGVDPSRILREDALEEGHERTAQHDVILSNPPFGGSMAADVDSGRYEVRGVGSEGLFLQHILTSLRPGGRAAVVCPEGLLANTGQPAKLRRRLMDVARIDAVISLPGGVFNPYTGVRTGILLFTKGEPTKRAWFFDVGNDGFSQDARRQPQEMSDLPLVLDRFPRRGQSRLSVTASRASLRAHEDRLVASRYLHEAIRPRPVNSVQLGDLCTLVKEPTRPSDAPESLFTYIAMEHVEPHTGNLMPVEPSLGRDIKSIKTRFAPGDILYGKLRPYLAKVVLVETDGICSTELLVLRPDPRAVRPEYLAEALRSTAFTESAVAMTVGANHPRIHPRDLLRIKVPVPPSGTQEEIVATATAARADIGKAQAAIKRARRKIETTIDAAWG